MAAFNTIVQSSCDIKKRFSFSLTVHHLHQTLPALPLAAFSPSPAKVTVLCHHVARYRNSTAQHGKHLPLPASFSNLIGSDHQRPPRHYHGTVGRSVPHRQLDLHLHVPHHLHPTHLGRPRHGNASHHRGDGLIGKGKTNSPGRPKFRVSRAVRPSSCSRSMTSIACSNRA